MRITVEALHDARPDGIRAAADAWGRLADAADTAVEQLYRDTGDLEYVWPSGPAAQAARDTSSELKGRVGNAHDHCHRIAIALRGFAGDVEHYRRALHDLVRDIRAEGFGIDVTTGVISLPPGTLATPVVFDTTLRAYEARLKEILDGADRAEAQACATLGENTLREGFTTSSGVVELSAISVEVARSNTAGSNAEWWAGMHPANQERAIREYPEIIGAAPGLPIKDRDAANRTLLRREADRLAAREGELLGHGSRLVPGVAPLHPELADVSNRLAGIRRLEYELAGDDGHLIGYQPGDEAAAVIVHGDPRTDGDAASHLEQKRRDDALRSTMQ